ncbi:hypothetical protein TH63_09390 [Rufibacter radiotolerans]|uniref:STAS/SEC14 domain-containing protein n=1 Tax=Rufibacter radiotolerans TaxID=1379910 RepID=A0A0H4VKC8_9BACT|nr:hypothetical protein [Rufibacter radiotolerans]AKQ45808.1 hypothetical protein TH63_09390 [Rufibacter radiotolerans]
MSPIGMEPEEQVELKRVYGNVFCRISRNSENSIVHARWFGPQSEETVKEGGQKLLELMSGKPYAKLLNCNREVIGSWDMALEWVQSEWAPQMRKEGLQYLAYVVPTSIYAIMTVESLIQRIDDTFEIRTFDDEQKALTWLLSQAG